MLSRVAAIFNKIIWFEIMRNSPLKRLNLMQLRGKGEESSPITKTNSK